MAEEHFDAVVDVSADTSAAKAQVLGLQQRLREIERNKLNIRADTSTVKAQILDLRKQIEAGASFGLNDVRAKAKLKSLQSDVRELTTVKLRVDADTLRARAQLASLKDVNLKADVDTGRGLSGLQSLVRNAGDLNRSLSKLPTPLLAAAGAAALVTGGVLATTAAVGGTVAAVGVLGAVSLRENARIKAAFTGTAGEIGRKFELMSERLIPSFERIADGARKSFERATPDLDRLIAASGPAIEGLAAAAGSFAEAALPGFRALAEASGPVIEGLKEFSQEVGESVARMFERMADSSDGAGAGLRLLGDVVSSTVDLLGDLIVIANETAKVLKSIDDFLPDQGDRSAEDVARNLGIDPARLKAAQEQVSGIKDKAAKEDQERLTAQNKALSEAEASRQRLLAIQKQSAPLATLDATQFQSRVDAALGGYQQLQDAARALSQSEASEAATRAQSARSEAAARRSVASAAQGVRDAQEAGLRQIASAERAVADAQLRTRDAQESLTQARKDAAQAIVDMQRTLRDLPDTEESARLRLARAQLGADEATGGTGLSALQRQQLEEDVKRREALLELKNAQEELDDALSSGAKTRADAQEMDRRGIENAPGVLNAKTALTAALQNQRDAEQALGQTRVDAARAVTQANQALAAASENLNETLQANALRAQEAALRTQEMREKAQKAKVDADLLAASMGFTSAQLAAYSDKVNQVPTLALKLAGESDVISALDAVTIKARAIQLLALNPAWSASKATQEAATEVTGKKTIQDAISKFAAHIRERFQFRATGGEIFGPGTSTSDSVPVMASRGEFMQPADSVQHYGKDFMEAVRTKRLPKFASGGLIDFPVANFKNIIETMEGGGLYQRVRENAQKYAKSRVQNRPSFEGGGPAPTGALAEWIAAAMSHTGVPASWAGPLNTLIMRESGGNPKAINNWDINAQNGVPSQGLMQTIPPTFAAYRDPSLSSDITDPIANIVAGINYIKARYGSIFNVQQANASAPPQGYKEGGLIFDEGGILPQGRSVVDNRTGKPEPLLRTDKSIDLSTDTITVLVRMLAQVLASRPAVMTLPNGRVLAETVSEAQLTDITISGVTR